MVAALVHGRRAFELDPLSPQRPVALAGLYHLARDYEGVLSLVEEGRNRGANLGLGLFFEAWALRQLGKEEQATSSLAKMLLPLVKSSTPDDLSLSGDSEDLIRRFLDLEGGRAPLRPYFEAMLLAWIGDADRCSRALAEAQSNADASMMWLPVSPVFDRVRSDPRIQHLVMI